MLLRERDVQAVTTAAHQERPRPRPVPLAAPVSLSTNEASRTVRIVVLAVRVHDHDALPRPQRERHRPRPERRCWARRTRAAGDRHRVPRSHADAGSGRRAGSTRSSAPRGPARSPSPSPSAPRPAVAWGTKTCSSPSPPARGREPCDPLRHVDAPAGPRCRSGRSRSARGSSSTVISRVGSPSSSSASSSVCSAASNAPNPSRQVWSGHRKSTTPSAGRYDRRVQRAPAAGVGGAEQRRTQERVGESLGGLGLVLQQLHDAPFALDRAGRPRLLRPLHDALVVRGGGERAEDGLAVGRQVGGEQPTAGIDAS